MHLFLSPGFSVKLWTEVRTNAPVQQEFLCAAAAAAAPADSGAAAAETSEKLLTFDRDPRAKLDVSAVPVLHLAAARDTSTYTTVRSRAKCYDFYKGLPPSKQTGAVSSQSDSKSNNDAFFACNQCDHMYQNANDLQYHLTLHSF